MHVDRQNRSAKFWLDPDVALADNHGYSRKELHDLERIRSFAMNGMLSAPNSVALSRIHTVRVTDDTLAVDLEDGRTIAVPLGWYPRLVYGTAAARANFEISGAGYGIHWPDLDEDIGVEGLLLGWKSSESRTSFERWLQRRR